MQAETVGSSPLKEGQGLIVPRDVHSGLTFSSFLNALMRLWPLAVGTSLPETGFDKVDRPSGTSYRVPLLSLLNLVVVLFFHGQQSGDKVSGLWPQTAQAILPLGTPQCWGE